MTQQPAGERGPDVDTGCRESPLHARLPLSPNSRRKLTSLASGQLLAGRSFVAAGVSRVREPPACVPVTAPSQPLCSPRSLCFSKP